MQEENTEQNIIDKATREIKIISKVQTELNSFLNLLSNQKKASLELASLIIFKKYHLSFLNELTEQNLELPKGSVDKEAEKRLEEILELNQKNFSKEEQIEIAKKLTVLEKIKINMKEKQY